MEIRPERLQSAHNVAVAIVSNKPRYNIVSTKTGVPWYFIGCVHERESSLNFHTHLHNGDPLTHRTYHVPAGRPLPPAEPPFTWEASATDALKLEHLDKIVEWPMARVLYQFEAYNGWGYLGRTNSPYVWAGSNQYSSGKYVGDHKYEAGYKDTQLGCAVILKQIMALDGSVILEMTGKPAPKVTPTETARHPQVEPQRGPLTAALGALASLFK